MASIKIDFEKCKGCGLCVINCPLKTIEIGKKTNKLGYCYAVKAREECTGCAMCYQICPDAVIEVER